MGMIRGKVTSDREVRPRTLRFGASDSPIVECVCGKFKNRDTGEHLETMTWEEIEKLYGDKCQETE